MKQCLALFCAIMVGVFCGMNIHAKETATPESRLGWRLAVQAWSFNHDTLFEAIDKTAALGVHYLEAYPGQKLSKDADVAFDQNLPAPLQDEVLTKLKQAGIKLVNYGVVETGEQESENRKLFDFAKRMGIETIVTEPTTSTLPQLDRLCREYKINIAIHNHPKPSRYWNPETLATACQGLSPRVGACADINHWIRSGVDPLEAIKLLKGRIVSLHFKDIAKRAPDGLDVPWGTGASNLDSLLAELQRQGFHGVFSAEHEIVNWQNVQPELAQSFKYFHHAAAKLAANTTN